MGSGGCTVGLAGLLVLVVMCGTAAAASLRVRLSAARPSPASSLQPGSQRLTPSLVKSVKLPVWPVHAGVVAQVLEWIGLADAAEAVVSSVGGRVVPIQMGAQGTSPWLLLAHHQHSFTPFDPLRAISSLLLPEGFPAHPHSGFSTLTYAIEGGLRHRDSEGLKMSYGDGDVQLMTAGRGTIHEEMWDLEEASQKQQHKRIELFQLWVNSPAKDKFCAPRVEHLRSRNVPLLTCKTSGLTAKVICGSVSLGSDTSAAEGPLDALMHSPVAVLHVTLPPLARVHVEALDGQCSFVAYVRRGLAQLPAAAAEGGEGRGARMGDLLLFEQGGGAGTAEEREEEEEEEKRGEGEGEGASVFAELVAGPRGLDALLLLGKPLREPVMMQGPFVHASEQGYRRAAAAFGQMGNGVYWDHTATDEDWQRHTRAVDLQGRLKQLLGL